MIKRILVIGATGNIGRPVVSDPIASGVRVRALTRDPDSAGLQEAERVKGDLVNPATLTPALRGVDSVFLRILLEEGHAGRDYVLTGPESLTQGE